MLLPVWRLVVGPSAPGTEEASCPALHQPEEPPDRARRCGTCAGNRAPDRSIAPDTPWGPSRGLGGDAEGFGDACPMSYTSRRRVDVTGDLAVAIRMVPVLIQRAGNGPSRGPACRRLQRLRYAEDLLEEDGPTEG